MFTDHVIAQCRWDSTFNQQTEAVVLQNFLSQWSRTILKEELNQCFDRLCPATQTWRIDVLHVDLGDIAFNDLALELPRRLRAGIQDVLSDMLAQQDAPSMDQRQPNFQILEQSDALQEFFIWFLQHGSAPWWFKGQQSTLQMLDAMLDQHASAAMAIVRDVGRSETVRKRLVWQLGEDRVRQIIQLLEPWQGSFICAYADNLFAVQSRSQLPTEKVSNNATEFRHSTWLHILSYLLLDRGTLFNTAAFVRAGLRHIAQQYGIDHQTLLAHMFLAVQALAPKGAITQPFLSAITMIHQEDMRRLPPPAALPTVSTNFWPQWQAMLRHGLQRRATEQGSVELGQLFTMLAQQDTSRMAQLLRQEGASSSVREGILRHFSLPELALLVRVLEPQQHVFIMQYAEHLQTLTGLQRWEQKAVWQVLLAYLLVAHRAHFDRRQIVRDTLLHIGTLHRYDYALLLDLLLRAVSVAHLKPQHFALLNILRELQGEQAHKLAAGGPRHRLWQTMRHYLQTGHGAMAGMVDIKWMLPVLLAPTGTVAQQATLWARLLHTADQAHVSDALLSERLLVLAGTADFPRLLTALAPGAAEFCLALLSNLLRWHQSAALPSLDRIDLTFRLPALLIEALCGDGRRRQGRRAAFSLMPFWQWFTALLRQRGVKLDAFGQQLRHAMRQDHLAGRAASHLALLPVAAHGALVATWLLPLIGDSDQSKEPSSNRPTHPDALTPQASPRSDLTTWAPAQLCEALRRHLTRQHTLADPTLPVLWRYLMRDGDQILSHWLERQTDCHHLLQLLTQQRQQPAIERWLLAQLPAELNPPDAMLKHWSALLLQGGAWQGASAVLAQQLEQVFWAVSFDARSAHLSTAALLARMATSACLRLQIRLSDCLASFKHHLPLLQHTHWRQAYALMLEPAALIAPAAKPAQAPVRGPSQTATMAFRQDYLGTYLNHPRLIDIARHLLHYGRAPSWLASAPALDLTRLLHDLFTVRPDHLPALLNGLQHQPAALFRLAHSVPFAWLTDAMRMVAPAQQPSIVLIEQLQHWLETTNMPNVSRQQRLSLLFQLVLEHWLAGHWHALQPERLIADFVQRLLRERPVTTAVLAQVQAAHQLPDTLQRAWRQAIHAGEGNGSVSIALPVAQSSTPAAAASIDARLNTAIAAARRPTPKQESWQETSKIPMRLNNIGLVLLQSFIPHFLEHLGLLENDAFIHPEAQRRAVHYLQFLVTGCSATPEQYLLLNKLLCGLPLQAPIEMGIDISADEVILCEGLLDAVIAYWREIGSSSTAGFRGNWLVRDGSLSDAGDHWHLIADQRAYDVLLARLPFSFSVIKFPWMEKAIYVTWPS